MEFARLCGVACEDTTTQGHAGGFPQIENLTLTYCPIGSSMSVNTGADWATASTKCARGMLRIVNSQLATAFANALQHLRSRSEAWEIGTSVRDIESSLDRFGRVHDDSIKSFYAYISAPGSSDLLREHGFVGFDESGGQAVHTDSINVLNSNGYSAVLHSSDSCKKRLRSLGSEDPEDLPPVRPARREIVPRCSGARRAVTIVRTATKMPVPTTAAMASRCSVSRVACMSRAGGDAVLFPNTTAPVSSA